MSIFTDSARSVQDISEYKSICESILTIKQAHTFEIQWFIQSIVPEKNTACSPQVTKCAYVNMLTGFIINIFCKWFTHVL